MRSTGVPTSVSKIAGVGRDAMAILEGDDWPGSVRELEAVVKQAMVRRRRGWVTRGDFVLPRLRPNGLSNVTRPLRIRLTSVQDQALRLKAAHGEVRRADVVARCRISHEAARRALASLAGSGSCAGSASDGPRSTCRWPSRWRASTISSRRCSR